MIGAGVLGGLYLGEGAYLLLHLHLRYQVGYTFGAPGLLLTLGLGRAIAGRLHSLGAALASGLALYIGYEYVLGWLYDRLTS